MGGVIRCYRTPPGQPAIGGSPSTHGLLLTRPAARGGAIRACADRPRKACKHRMQDGMKCASCGHARDVTWEVGWRGVRHTLSVYPRNAVARPSPETGPTRDPQKPCCTAVWEGAVARRNGMLPGHSHYGTLEGRTPERMRASAVHAQHSST